MRRLTSEEERRFERLLTLEPTLEKMAKKEEAAAYAWLIARNIGAGIAAMVGTLAVLREMFWKGPS